MKIAHEGKDHGVKEIILSSVVASGRGNADVLIHRSIFAGQMGFVL